MVSDEYIDEYLNFPQGSLSPEEREKLRPRHKLLDGKLYLNYTANFLWIGRCRGDLATSLRLRGASLKAFAEVGLTAAVREVLRRAAAPDTAGLRAELQSTTTGGSISDLHGSLAAILNNFSKTFQEDALRRELLLKEGLVALRNEMKAYVDIAIAKARESSVVEITRQKASSSLQKEEELRSLCRELPGGEEGSVFLKDYGHLPVSSYLEQKLPLSQHYVIRHFMPPFSSRVQEARLDLATKPGTEMPFMAWNNGAWRIVYFEADRESMDAIFDSEAMKATRARMLRDHVPSVQGANQRAKRQRVFGGRRRGPYATQTQLPQPLLCESANVSVETLTSFFGVDVDASTSFSSSSSTVPVLP